MKAVFIDKPEGLEVLRQVEDFPVPKLKDSEIVVRTKYSRMNYINTYFRTVLHPVPTLPLVLGCESIGEVVAIDESNPYGLKHGDDITWMHQGTLRGLCKLSFV